MVDSVELLQYGDDPEIEPGELLGKIFIAPPEGADLTDNAVRHKSFSDFSKLHRPALAELRKVLEVTSFGGGLHDLNFPNTTLSSARGPSS